MVWKRKTVGELTLRELEEYRATKRVEEQQLREVEAFGEEFREAPAEQLTARILGIRRDLESVVPDIVQAGTNAAIEPQKGFFREVASIIAPETYKKHLKSSAEKEFESVWGKEESIEKKRLHVAEVVWKELKNSQRSTVREYLDKFPIEPLKQSKTQRLDRPVRQLANATVNQLRALRAQAIIDDKHIFPQPLPTRPAERFAAPPSNLDRLIEIRSIEDQIGEQTGSTTKFDPERLQDFLDELQGDASKQEIYILITKILEDHKLLGLRNDAPLKAAIAKLRLWDKTLGSNVVKTRLQSILEELPTLQTPVEEPEMQEEESEEKKEEKQKTSEQHDLGKDLLRLRDELLESYNADEILDRRLASIKFRFQETIDASRPVQGREIVPPRRSEEEDEKDKKEPKEQKKERSNVNLGFSDLHKQLKEKEDQHDELLAKIYKLEYQFKSKLESLQELLKDSEKLEKLPQLQADGSVQNAVHQLKTSDLIDIGSGQKQRLDSAQFLFQLNLEAKRTKDVAFTQKNMETAQQETLRDIARASNVEMDRAQTRELAEKLGASKWDSFKKLFIARFTEGQVYTMQDILTGITQKGSELEVFAPLSPSMTDDELHVWLDENPEEETEKLVLYVEKIKDCLKGFRYDGGKVELLDRDAYPLASFVRRLQNIIAVRRVHASTFTEKFEPGKSAVSQATIAMKELYEAEEEENKSIFGKLKDKAKSIGRWINRNILGREKKDIVEEIKSKKMNKEEAASLLEGKGLAGVAGIGAAASAAVEIAEKGSWAKRGWRGAKAAPRAVRRGGGRFLRGAETVLKYGTAPLWWPLKQGWRGAKWTGGKLGGGVQWIGSKAAKFWRWI